MSHSTRPVNKVSKTTSTLLVSLYRGWWLSLDCLGLRTDLSLTCRYQNFFRIAIWIVFLVIYSQAGALSEGNLTS